MDRSHGKPSIFFRRLLSDKTIGKQSRRPSGLYGRLVSGLMETRNRAVYEKTLKELNIKKGDKIFEIGYGTGLGINLLANTAFDCTIGGIDYSDLMHKKAIKRNNNFVASGIVDLKCGDFLTVDPDDQKYDKIFCVNVIYFWNDLNGAFKKIYSMLNKGGIYCLFMLPEKELEKLVFAEDFCKYSIEKVVSELKKVGFEYIEYAMDKGYYVKTKK